MMRITLETNDETLAGDLMDNRETVVGSKMELPGGIVVNCDRNEIRRGAGSEILIQLAISFVSGVSSQVLGSWLFKKLEGRLAKISINRREVRVEEAELESVIDQEREREG
ncbi:MAG: hypothetical protein JXB62_22895 [Pirellulales bacterium]|nr:hypothetical protein [Pirellulales bacterium]